MSILSHRLLAIVLELFQPSCDARREHVNTMKTSNISDNHSSEIPNILHFAWGFLGGSKILPGNFQDVFERWQTLNPTWQTRLNSPKDAAELASQYEQFPYLNYKINIQRCDACRPMLLHQYGGVYSDLDVVPHKALDVLTSLYPNAAVLLCEETSLSTVAAQTIGKTQPIRNNIPELPRRVANYFMASVPGHPIWLEVMALMKQRSTSPIKNDYDILYTTGPDIISEVAHRATECYSDVVVIPQSTINKFITHTISRSWRGVSRNR